MPTLLSPEIRGIKRFRRSFEPSHVPPPTAQTRISPACSSKTPHVLYLAESRGWPLRSHRDRRQCSPRHCRRRPGHSVGLDIPWWQTLIPLMVARGNCDHADGSASRVHAHRRRIPAILGPAPSSEVSPVATRAGTVVPGPGNVGVERWAYRSGSNDRARKLP